MPYPYPANKSKQKKSQYPYQTDIPTLVLTSVLTNGKNRQVSMFGFQCIAINIKID
jgi:hypothetical protein